MTSNHVGSAATLRHTARILLKETYVEAQVVRESGNHIRLEGAHISVIPNRFQIVFDSEARAYDARLLWLEGTFALIQVLDPGDGPATGRGDPP